MKHYSNNKTKKIKAFFSVILSVVMLLSLSSVCLAAMAGDIDGDGRISAADSRVVARVAIGLDVLTDEQAKAADVLQESATETIINVMDAREILRMAVGLANIEAKQVTFTDITDSYDGKIKLFCEEKIHGIRLYIMADRVTELNAFELSIDYDESKLKLVDEKYSVNTGDFNSGTRPSICLNTESAGALLLCGYFNQNFSCNGDNEDYFGYDYELKDAYTLKYFDFDFINSDAQKGSCDFTVNGKIYAHETSYSIITDSCTFTIEEEETTESEGTTEPVPPTAHTHSFSSEVIIEPGCDTIGEQEFTCSCGEIYRGIIPATGHTDDDADGICDACDKDISEKDNSSDNNSEDSSDFLSIILSIIKKIADFFKNLFGLA